MLPKLKRKEIEIQQQNITALSSPITFFFSTSLQDSYIHLQPRKEGYKASFKTHSRSNVEHHSVLFSASFLTV